MNRWPRRRQRSQDEIQIDMTPMLDIVFIMLIFFIVTSSFIREHSLAVAPPQASQGSAVTGEVLHLVMQADGQLQLDGQPVTRTQLGERLSMLGEGKGHQLLILAPATASHGEVVALMDQARASGISQMAIAVTTP